MNVKSTKAPVKLYAKLKPPSDEIELAVSTRSVSVRKRRHGIPFVVNLKQTSKPTSVASAKKQNTTKPAFVIPQPNENSEQFVQSNSNENATTPDTQFLKVDLTKRDHSQIQTIQNEKSTPEPSQSAAIGSTAASDYPNAVTADELPFPTFICESPFQVYQPLIIQDVRSEAQDTADVNPLVKVKSENNISSDKFPFSTYIPDHLPTDNYEALSATTSSTSFYGQNVVLQKGLLENANEINSLPYANLLCDEVMPHDYKDESPVTSRDVQTPQWLIDMSPRGQKMLQELKDLRKCAKEKDQELKRVRLNHEKVTSELLQKVGTLQQKLNDQNTRIVRLEAMARRKSLILSNVKENETTNEALMQIVIQLMCTIGVCLSPDEIDYVERIGVSLVGQHRSILVSLMSVMKKRDILKKQRKAVGFSISENINVDLI